MALSQSDAAAVAPPTDLSQIRVMVVDDSVVIRGLVGRWLSAAEGVEVVAKCSNGRLAVESLSKVDPDVVVLDIEMPEMDGMTALEKMLKIKPSLVVIMASTLTRRNARISMKALDMGAADYVPKPEGNSAITTSEDFRREIVDKVLALGARFVRRRVRKFSAPAAKTAPAKSGFKIEATATADKSVRTIMQGDQKISLRPYSKVKPKIIAIGSSTGGPNALLNVLKLVAPATKSVPIVITQHMPATFTAILADHLSKTTGAKVKEGENGEQILAGHVYIAPGEYHMFLKKTAGSVFVKLTEGPAINFCKPSVDPMFECVSNIYGSAVLAIVLTGMGHDGRHGARIIADAGGSVIAQDEETSVVWGMPGAAAEAGVCCAVLPLDKIGPETIRLSGEAI